MARRKRERDVPAGAPDHATGNDGKVQVWNPDSNSITWVTPIEAAGGMIAWARREYGQGTPGFAAVAMKAVALLREHGLSPTGRKLTDPPLQP
jgi:hypothetical protein